MNIKILITLQDWAQRGFSDSFQIFWISAWASFPYGKCILFNRLIPLLKCQVLFLHNTCSYKHTFLDEHVQCLLSSLGAIACTEG